MTIRHDALIPIPQRLPKRSENPLLRKQQSDRAERGGNRGEMGRVSDRTSLRLLGVRAAALEDLQLDEAERHEPQGEPGHDPGEEHEEAGGARVRPPLQRPERRVLPLHDQRHRAHPRRRGRARRGPRRRRHHPHRRRQAHRPRPPRRRRHRRQRQTETETESELALHGRDAWAPYKAGPETGAERSLARKRTRWRGVEAV